jgi:3'-phosphoadenosine 5'-phosphosulfate sulfotransferase (PAPS reductase)/FAD synthetase
MNENDFEFLLEDRILKIQSFIEKYGEENFYISFSGGKDSTVLHYLIDMAIPNNKIPRVFSNTGLEFRLVYKFVKSLQEKDNRIIIISPHKNIVKTLERVGYPFKSKFHSQRVSRYQNGCRTKTIADYKTLQGKSRFVCPKKLLYQFEDDFTFKISDRCCYEFKKDTILGWLRIGYKYEKYKSITITGMKSEEGGQRANMNCTVFNDGELVKFHPLAPLTDKWEEWFIKKYNIQLCELYYPPYNFKRTGCVGCPFNIKIKEELETLKRLLPSEYKRANLYFGKVYDEYRRIDYRL